MSPTGSRRNLAGLDSRPIRVQDYREDNTYVLEAELPGVDAKKDVKVIVDHGHLTIEAQRSVEKHDEHRTEFRYGILRRTVMLPASAEENTSAPRGSAACCRSRCR